MVASMRVGRAARTGVARRRSGRSRCLGRRVIEQRYAGSDPTWSKRRANMWHFYLADPPKPHYVGLRHLLNDLADRLATDIDRRRGRASRE